MAKEYIEREEVIKILEHYDLSSGSTLGCHSGAIECAISAIERLPAADVSPVQLGEWIDVDTSYWRWYHDTARTVFSKSFRCSECGRKTIIREKFCPSCGTKMDKEKV